MIFDGLYGDGVGGAAGGEDGEKGGALFSLGADDGDVAGVCVGGQEEMLVGGEGQSFRGGAGVDSGYELAIVDAVDADEVCAEVRYPEGAVVAADDALHGLAADGVSAEDFVGPGGDFRDAVGAEVGDEDLAAVGLEGEMNGREAYVEQGEDVIGGECGVLLGGPGAGSGGEIDGHDLMAGGTGDEGLGGVGEDGDVGGSGAAGEGGAQMEDGAGRVVGGYVEDGDAVATAIGNDERAHIGGDTGEAGLLAGAGDGDFAATVEVDNADGVGTGVGDVGTVTGGLDADEVGEAVDADGGDDAVGGGVDDGDGARLGVDDVDLVADGVDGDAGGVEAYLKGAVLAEIDDVEDGDGVGGSVGDVGELDRKSVV